MEHSGSVGSFYPPIGLGAFETQFLNFAARHPKAQGGAAGGLSEKEAAALVAAYYAHGGLHPDDVEGFRQIVRSAIGLYVCKSQSSVEQMLKDGTSYVGMFSTPVVGISHVLKLAADFRSEVSRLNVLAVKKSLAMQHEHLPSSPGTPEKAQQPTSIADSGWHHAIRRAFEHLAGEGQETTSLSRLEQFVVGMLHGWQVPQTSLKLFLIRLKSQITKAATLADFTEFVIEPLRFLMSEAAGRTAAMIDPHDAQQQQHRQSSTKSSSSGRHMTGGSVVGSQRFAGRRAGGGYVKQQSNNLFQSIDRISERQDDLQLLHETVLVSPRTMEQYCKTTCILQNLQHLKSLNYRRLQRFCDRMFRHGNRKRFPGRVVACVTFAAGLCSKHRECARCEWVMANTTRTLSPRRSKRHVQAAPADASPTMPAKKRPTQPTEEEVQCTFKPFKCPYPPRASPRASSSAPRLVVNESLLVLNISRALDRRDRDAAAASLAGSIGGPLDFRSPK